MSISFGIISLLRKIWVSQVTLVVKEHACQSRSRKRGEFDPWVRKIPWRRAWQLTPVFLPGESHGQRSLAGCSPRGHRESDRTVWVSTARAWGAVIIRPWRWLLLSTDFFCGDENVLTLTVVMATQLWTTELYTIKGCTSWDVNYISINLFF